MDAMLFGADAHANPSASEPLAGSVAANEVTENPYRIEKQPLIRGFVRPSGFEPETCGLRVRCSAIELEARSDPTPRLYSQLPQRWIDFVSRNSSIPNLPSSRPMPDCL
jgi:hypothetical protein